MTTMMTGVGTIDDDIPAAPEQDEPAGNGQKGQGELPGDGHQQRHEQQRRDQRLDNGAGGFHDREAEDAKDGQEDVLAVVGRPLVGAQRTDGVGRVERRLQLGQVGGGRLAAA